MNNNQNLKSSVSQYLQNKQLDQKLEQLGVRKTKRKPTTTAQKLLLFHQIGLLEKINDLKLQVNKRALLISLLIDGDSDNIESDLRNINFKSSKLDIKTNYQFLVEIYKKLGLKDMLKKAEIKLLEIEKIKAK